MDTCLFCKIIRGALPCHRVWEDEHFLAFLDIRPINPGHLLLVPKGHEDDIFNLPDAEYTSLMRKAKQLAGPLRKVTNAKRIGIAVEGFGVPHVHVHLIPINAINEIDPHRAKEATQASLLEMSGKLRARMMENGGKCVIGIAARDRFC